MTDRHTRKAPSRYGIHQDKHRRYAKSVSVVRNNLPILLQYLYPLVQLLLILSRCCYIHARILLLPSRQYAPIQHFSHFYSGVHVQSLKTHGNRVAYNIRQMPPLREAATAGK